MLNEFLAFYEVPDVDRLAFLVRDFDSHESQSSDRCLNTYVFGLQGKGEIFFQVLYLVQLHSLGWFEPVLNDGRADRVAFHFNFKPELKQCLLDFQ